MLLKLFEIQILAKLLSISFKQNYNLGKMRTNFFSFSVAFAFSSAIIFNSWIPKISNFFISSHFVPCRPYHSLFYDFAYAFFIYEIYHTLIQSLMSESYKYNFFKNWFCKNCKIKTKTKIFTQRILFSFMQFMNTEATDATKQEMRNKSISPFL